MDPLVKAIIGMLLWGFVLGVVLALAIMETVRTIRVIRLMRAFRR